MRDRRFLVLIGTKAQFIKTAPILREMDQAGLRYRLVYTGQHSETFDMLEAAFETRPADDILVPESEAATRRGFLGWAIRYWLAVIRRLPSWRDHRAGIVHGDTASTLFGAISIRLAGVPVAHIEAGLRSSALLDPFPEELIRRIVSRMTRLHLAPDEVSTANLAARKGVVVNTQGNSIRDSLQHSLAQGGGVPELGGAGGYAVVSLHRNENLSNAENLDLILEEVLLASRKLPIIFVLHPATRERIKANGWFTKLLGQPQIQLRERMDHASFVRLLIDGCMLMTDGGSNQEEAAMIGLPTLLLRKNTERNDGLDSGIVVMSRLERSMIRDFVGLHAGVPWRPSLSGSPGSSKACVDALINTFPDMAKDSSERTS